MNPAFPNFIKYMKTSRKIDKQSTYDTMWCQLSITETMKVFSTALTANIILRAEQLCIYHI